MKKQSVVKKSDDEKQKRPGNKTNQSVAQGLSIAESMLLSENPWGISFSSDAQRGMDEYTDAWTSINSLNLSYRLDAKSAVGVNLGYETLIYKHDGKLFNNEDADPGRYGLTDLDISYTRPQVWSDKYNRLVWNTVLTLPTSRASIRNSLLAGVTTSLALRYRPTAKWIITPSLATYYRQFQYETANEMGLLPNSPVGFRYGLSASYTFNSWLIGNASYSQTQRYDFFDDWFTIQSGTVALIVNATDVLNLSAGYNWRDRMITNEPLFDDDRSIFFIGVGYVF